MGEAMQFFDPPPVRYMGSKWQLAKWIISHMPPHDIYVEPFCGGAAIFFRKSPSELEALNDLNGEVLNFFDVLRTREDELVRAIDLTPYSEAEYERSLEPMVADSLERARRFYVRSYQGIGGGSARRAGWRSVTDLARGSTPASDWSRLTGLHKGAHRLKAAQLHNQSALEIIARYDTAKTLFYVDPPYVLDSRKDSRNVYAHEMTDLQHRELADVLHHISGMALLSGYQCDLYDELYADWHVTSKTTTTNGNSTATEYLWISPNASNLNRWPLFEERNG